MMEFGSTITFLLGGMVFEYDSEKEAANIKKHGISFRTAARVFFDEDYIEEADTKHSDNEQRHYVIGDTSAGNSLNTSTTGYTIIGNVDSFAGETSDILYVVYTERSTREQNGVEVDIIRIISARLANNFERGLYYGQYL